MRRVAIVGLMLASFIAGSMWHRHNQIRINDVVAVELSKTMDGGDWTVSVKDEFGNTQTLWMYGGREHYFQPVRTVTDY